jgi:putative selenate reductase molybdopterin-binding subunit
MAVDCGTAINPQTAEGQIEGGLAQALGHTVSEAMVYDDQGRVLTRRFGDYRVFQADEMPFHAVGARVRELPLTPERVWRAMRG